MAERGKIQLIAERCGVNQATVRRALASAGLKAGRGGYDFDAAVAAVNAIADPARINGHAVTRGNVGNGGAMQEARTRHEELKARRLEIDNAKAERELISRQAVKATCASVVAVTRTAVLTLGNRVAEKIAGLTDVKAIARIVDAQVRELLGELADADRFFEIVESEALS
jgi:hypothetical protein